MRKYRALLRVRAPTRELWLARQSRDRLGPRALARVIWADGWPGRLFLATLASAAITASAAIVAACFI